MSYIKQQSDQKTKLFGLNRWHFQKKDGTTVLATLKTTKRRAQEYQSISGSLIITKLTGN